MTRRAVDLERVRLLARGVVVADPSRCVQCGICAYNCPVGIDTRRQARRGGAFADARCILCGSCVARCPRGTLRFERWDGGTGSPAPTRRTG